MARPILLVEDEPTLARNVQTYLQRFGYQVHISTSGEQALTDLGKIAPHAVLLDFNLPGINGLQVLNRIRSRNRETRVVMVTGFGSEQVAVDAMKSGADDYLTKPLELGRLRETLDRILPPEAGAEGASGAVPDSGLARLLGHSSAMTLLKSNLSQLLSAESQLTDSYSPAVLITGETGTGKELVARALHYDGRRRESPFVEVNSSGIPANLLEAELFGFERGAFTDAKEQKIGLIEAAEGGTLFLDEIGELEPSAQAKLLKLLEDHLVRRLGSVRERKVDVRIIAATNRDLEQLVREGKFRSDLYFRLKIIQFKLPPLRERNGDVVQLARHFLEVHRSRYGKPRLRFGPRTEQILAEHHWPGNVRELRNIIEQCVVMARGDVIEADDLELTEPGSSAAPTENQVLGAGHKPMNLPQVEHDMLVSALKQCHGNVSQAARMLGVSRDTLRYRIEKYQLIL